MPKADVVKDEDYMVSLQETGDRLAEAADAYITGRYMDTGIDAISELYRAVEAWRTARG